MPHDLVIRNGRVVAPSGVVAGGVAVDDGRVVAVGDDLGTGHREIDLDGRVLFPGVVDPHVHFGLGDVLGDDGLRTDFPVCSRDCLVGGVTTIVTTTSIGPEPLRELFERARAIGSGQSWCDFKFNIPVTTRAQIPEIPELVAQGAVSFKFFTGYQGEQAAGFGMNPEGIPPDFFYLACEQLRAAGPPAFAMIHAEEPTVREMLIARRRADQRSDVAQLARWADASPRWGESVQAYMYGQIAADVGVPLYVVHVSLGHTVGLIRFLQAQGVDVIGETLALFLSTTAEEMDKNGFGARAKIQPPIRHEDDRRQLWAGLRDGTITIVGTDSLPYSRAFKERDPFWDARVGVNTQFADTVPLLVDALADQGEAGLELLARVLAENAARRYGIFPRKGAITDGADADFVVFDETQRGRLGVARYRGSADYCLWEGRSVRGIPSMTVLHGEVVMENGEIVGDTPSGVFVRAAER